MAAFLESSPGFSTRIKALQCKSEREFCCEYSTMKPAKHVQKEYFNPPTRKRVSNTAERSEDKYKGLKPHEPDPLTASSDLVSDDVYCHDDEQQYLERGEALDTGILKPGAARSRLAYSSPMDIQEWHSTQSKYQAQGTIVKKSSPLARSKDAIHIKHDFYFDDAFESNDPLDLLWWSDFAEERILDDDGFFVISTAADVTVPLHVYETRGTGSSQKRSGNLVRPGVDSGANCNNTSRRGPARGGLVDGIVGLPCPARKQGKPLGPSVNQPASRRSASPRRGRPPLIAQLQPRRSSESELSKGSYRRRRGLRKTSNEVPRRRSDSSINGPSRRMRTSIDSSNAQWSYDFEADFQGRCLPTERNSIKDRASKAFDTSTLRDDGAQQRRRSSRGTSRSSRSSENTSKSSTHSGDSESRAGQFSPRLSNNGSSIYPDDAVSINGREVPSSGGNHEVFRGPANIDISSRSPFSTRRSRSSHSSQRANNSTHTTSRTRRSQRRKASQDSFVEKLEQLTSSSRQEGNSVSTDSTVTSDSTDAAVMIISTLPRCTQNTRSRTR